MADKVLGLIGLGGKSPKTSPAPTLEVEDEKKKAKTARSSLLETEGGILGMELQPGQVKRDSLFGN